jgi:hypothetical protein
VPVKGAHERSTSR